MIKYIKKDPIFRKLFILMISFTLLLSIVIIGLNYYRFRSFYNNQRTITEGTVGAILKAYPEEETKIIDSISSTTERDNIRLGRELLNKYGYNSNLSLNYNFKNTYKLFIFEALIEVIFLIFMAILIYIFTIKSITKDITTFSKEVEKVIEGDFSFSTEANKEGLFSNLHSQFYKMTNNLKMSLEELNIEKESMKAVVTEMSHQLKTPVASIKLSTSLLQEKDLSDEEREEFLQKCNESTERLQWLVDSLIKMSRLEVGIMEINKEKANIKNTVINAANNVYMKALSKNITIDMENIEDEIIDHDIKWTKEALTNILENAVKYTKDGGMIKIKTSRLATVFKIDIEDSGIGIPKEEINNIFKKFYRGRTKEVAEAEGLGVGLYLARRIIEKQSGSIMVYSEEGKGSKFSLLLQKCY